MVAIQKVYLALGFDGNNY